MMLIGSFQIREPSDAQDTWLRWHLKCEPLRQFKAAQSKTASDLNSQIPLWDVSGDNAHRFMSSSSTVDKLPIPWVLILANYFFK